MIYLNAPGVPAHFGTLKIPTAKDLWNFLVSELNPHAKAVEVRRGENEVEIIVFDVDIEVSQLRVHDIRPLERISVTFLPRPWHLEVLALRPDFPFVPHVNPREQEFPRSLCLYDQSFDEVGLRWTPASFIERIRWWLRETAKGTLHGNDQPLEPIFLDRFPPLILPADLLSHIKKGNPTRLDVIARSDLKIFRASSEPVQGPGVSFLATVVECPPHAHGVIRNRPTSVAAVDDLLRTTGLDLFQTLRTQISSWDRPQVSLGAHLIVIAVLPKNKMAKSRPWNGGLFCSGNRSAS